MNLEFSRSIKEEGVDKSKQLIVEQGGKRLAVVCFTDLDGTANDETIPEPNRLTTIDPARKALSAMEKNGILTGVNTGRSFGEANLYREKLGINGPIICEDGAVVVLPAHFRKDTARGLKAIEHGGQWAVILSTVARNKISDVLNQSRDEIKNSAIGPGAFITTIDSSGAEIMRIVGHADVNSATLSADRLASAYVAGASVAEIAVIKKRAATSGIRTFGDPLHLIGQDAHKGTALEYIDKNASMLFPDMNVKGILPIAIGNNTNDLKFMETCRKINDGIGILVGKPGGGFFVDESEVPDYVIKTKEPYGHGMKEALPQVYRDLNGRFGLRLQ